MLTTIAPLESHLWDGQPSVFSQVCFYYVEVLVGKNDSGQTRTTDLMDLSTEALSKWYLKKLNEHGENLVAIRIYIINCVWAAVLLECIFDLYTLAFQALQIANDSC